MLAAAPMQQVIVLIVIGRQNLIWEAAVDLSPMSVSPQPNRCSRPQRILELDDAGSPTVRTSFHLASSALIEVVLKMAKLHLEPRVTCQDGYEIPRPQLGDVQELLLVKPISDPRREI